MLLPRRYMCSGVLVCGWAAGLVEPIDERDGEGWDGGTDSRLRPAWGEQGCG